MSEPIDYSSAWAFTEARMEEIRKIQEDLLRRLSLEIKRINMLTGFLEELVAEDAQDQSNMEMEQAAHCIANKYKAYIASKE